MKVKTYSRTKTFIVGAALGAALALIPIVFLENTIIGATLGVMIFTYVFIMGLRKNGPFSCGVYSTFGGYIDSEAGGFPKRYAPSGWNWAPPHPFADVRDVDLRVRTLDRQRPANAPPEREGGVHVLTLDDVDINISARWQYRVGYPFKYVTTNDADTIYETQSARNARWYAKHYKVLEIANQFGDMSEFLGVKLDNEVTVPIVNEYTGLRKGESDDGTTDEIEEVSVEIEIKKIEAAAAKIGFVTDSAIVDDFGLPKAIIKANEQIKVEEQQAKSEMTETNNVIRLMARFKKEFPELSASEIADLVQAERGKIRRVVVGGSAGDVTKGIALLGENGLPGSTGGGS